MSEINSPLGRRSIASTPRKILTVPDESQPLLEEEKIQQVQQQRRELLEASKRPSAGARERIQFLTGLGRSEKVVYVGGCTFTLQSLKSAQIREVLKQTSMQQIGTDVGFAAREFTLAFSLKEIDGTAIALAIGDDSIEGRLKVLDEMDEELIDFLYKNYLEMMSEHKKKFVVETVAEAKEVAEELKK
jgi:hypothetical protein